MLNYGEILTSKVSCPICGNVGPSSGVKISVQDYLNISSGQDFVYVPCNCGVFYLENQPISSEIAKIYSKEYDAYHISEGVVAKIKKKRLQSLVAPLLSQGRGTKILDYGCGSGEFVYSASELVDAAVVGFDLFPPTHSNKSNVMFLDSEQSIKSLGPYQLIFAFQVIEHVSDPRLFINFLYSQLDSGGTLVIETPSSSGILFSSLTRKYWGGWHAPRHFLIFDKESLIKISTQVGFQVESFQFIPSPFQWIETFRALLGKSSKINKYLHLGNFLIVASVYLIDSIAIFLRFKSSNMKIVLRKI
jgi:2-polyprenyl-3-methyl-5-hydroxy-6-metoxy-1,4-benzoquinol methylase